MVDTALALLAESTNDVPAKITGYISMRGPLSVFDADAQKLSMRDTAPFRALPRDIDVVRKDLEGAGFEILSQSELGFSVRASPQAFEDLTKAKVKPFERLVRTNSMRSRYTTSLDLVDAGARTLGFGAARSHSTALKVDGVIIESPKQLFASVEPPVVATPHLRLPHDVARLLRAPDTAGARGEDVIVAVIDTGFWRHPFFAAHQYRVADAISVHPDTDPSDDLIGHGTGIAANLFAIAPRASLHPIRVATDQNVIKGTFEAIHRVQQLRPRVLTNSWGSDYPFPPQDQPKAEAWKMAQEISLTIELGIMVVFAAGNGHFAPEPQMPGVVSVGGVFVASDGAMQASSYASGYQGRWFDKPVVPTVSGLVGMAPRAQYLMLPVTEGSEYDVQESQVDEGVAGDGTSPHDGWALFSGTSSAAPQIAGAAAVLFGAMPQLTPSQVIEALTKTSQDIMQGRSHTSAEGSQASLAADSATGAGLVDVTAALAYAKARF